jgi:hypothetical protein
MTSFTRNLLPALVAFGKRDLDAIDEGAIPMTWRLRNYEGETCEVANDGTHTVELHNLLHAGWFDNDSLTTDEIKSRRDDQ